MPKKKEKPTLILIDAHAVIHRAYHALPDLTTPSGEPAGALYGVAAMLVKLLKEFKPEYIAAAYDLPGKTHRHEAYEEYKGTRTETDDALVEQFDRSRDIFEAFHIPTYDSAGFEADDVIGTLSEKYKKDFNIIIASGDMDTLQLVDGEKVQVFTLKKGINDTVLYNEKGVEERFGFKPPLLTDYKGLRGDPSDNIIGVKGIGEKTATKLIQTYGTIEKMYAALTKNKKKVKEKAEITERIANLLIDGQEEAEFSKVLATIRTDAPVKFKKEEAVWKEEFTSEKAVTLFTELGFRSLVARVKELAVENGNEEKEEKKTAPDQLFGESTDTQEFKEAAVMLFLLQSDTTNPKLDDILENTNSKTVAEAHKKLEAELTKADLKEIYETIEKPLIPVINKINETGVLIDLPYLVSLSKEYHKELNKIAKSIYKHAGEEFNINSPKQLGEILFEKLDIKGSGRRKKTATGQLSTKESELQKLKDEHPIIEDILKYRELAKLLGTYIDAIPPLLGDDGRLRTTFSQTGAATGRFSSKDPNLQNIPIKTENGRKIRRAFIAPEGKVLAAFDYSQIELRLAAFLSGDEKLGDIFKKGEDVHESVAAQMFNVKPEEVTKEMRRRAKVINFGILYGMGVNALRTNLDVERSEAQEYLNRYFETFSGLADYLDKTKAEAARLGYTTTHFGRKRYFPGLKSKLPFIRASAERMAINAPMQGTQADMIKLAMISIQNIIDTEFKGTAVMVMQIHDELIFELDKKVLDEFAPKVMKAMESVLTEKNTGGIPIVVTGEAGPNWAEMKKI